MSYYTRHIPYARPPSGGYFVPHWMLNGLIGLWRPETLYVNEAEVERPWSYTNLGTITIKPDPFSQFSSVWDFSGAPGGSIRVQDAITDPRGSLYQPEGGFTVSMWLNFRDNQQIRSVQIGHSNNINREGWGSYHETPNGGFSWTFRTWMNRWDDYIESNPIFPGRWYHLVFSHQQRVNGRVRQYVNGILDGFKASETRVINDTSSLMFGTGNSDQDSRLYEGLLAEVAFWNYEFDPGQVRALYDVATRWAKYSEIELFAPVAEGPPLFNLDVSNLNHARFLDPCNVFLESVNLPIENTDHLRPVDAPVITPNYMLFAANLLHARPLDELQLEVTTDLLIADLTHEVPIDQVDILATTATLLSIDELDHARALDVLLLEPTHNLLIDGLDHARFLEEADVQVLLGDATELRATAVDWRMDAGQTLITTAGADQNWHVIDCVFDGVNSEIRVDNGPAVVGDAGVRALELVSLGADVDGEHRAIGYIAEFRIYNNNIPLNFRQNIADFLINKWIQP